MPLKKSIKSLKELSLENVIKNFDKWYDHYKNIYGENNLNRLDVVGPFNSLPSTLLEEVTEKLQHVQGKNETLQYFQLLLTPHLRRLNLTCWVPCETEIQAFLHLATIRCPALELLAFKGYEQSLPLSYQMFLPMFPKLQKIDLKGTGVGDSCLQILGAFCMELRYLNVTGCPVTDVGLNGLCSNDFDGNEARRMGKCQFIHTLKMERTLITKKGIKMALENLPKLREFEFCNSVHILSELCKEDLMREQFKTYSICKFAVKKCTNHISCRQQPYEIGSLRLAATMCSFVNVVHITVDPGLTDIELQGLSELKTLSELFISAFSNGTSEREDCKITFDGGVLPLLKAFSSSLLRLKLSELNICINIRAIANYCPHLEYLNLDSNLSYSMDRLLEERHPCYPKRKKEDLILETLKVLDLSHGFSSESGFSSEMLALVISSPQLKLISIGDCQFFTDDIIEEAVRLHQFHNLENLQLYCCDSITKKGIDFIFNEKNHLKELGLHSCSLITLQDLEEWINKAKENNLEIEFEFYVDDPEEAEH